MAAQIIIASDEAGMRVALEEAAAADREGEVPVGAVVIAAAGQVLGRGHNRREAAQDPTAHAELLALQAAARALGSWRLCETTLYVTLEPCAMCAGALVNARVARLVYGCDDPKAGAVRTLFRLADDARLNHRLVIESGVLGAECAERLRSFFAKLRSGAP